MAMSRTSQPKQMTGSRKKVTPMKRGGKTTAPLSAAEKYRQLKAQTEAAGMKVEEKNGKIVVSRRRKS